MEMNLNKLLEIAQRTEESWRAAIHGVAESQTWFSDWKTKPDWLPPSVYRSTGVSAHLQHLFLESLFGWCSLLSVNVNDFLKVIFLPIIGDIIALDTPLLGFLCFLTNVYFWWTLVFFPLTWTFFHLSRFYHDSSSILCISVLTVL